MQIIGIKRAFKYSPNHINNDTTIFNMVVQHMAKTGIEVEIYDELEFIKIKNRVSPDFIFTMSRNPDVLECLKELVLQSPVQIINSPFGIERCFRSNITNIFTENEIPVAASIICPTDHFDSASIQALDNGHGFWLKRGDFHAIQKEDVVFAADMDGVLVHMQHFQERGIAEVVISAHLKGDLVKFYGVNGTGFFHWLYPFDKNHYKYQKFKTISGATMYYPFDVNYLQQIAQKIATAASVPVYGGDAVIDALGNISIIDFNDWPSFAPCREEAAVHIAQFLISEMAQHVATRDSISK